MSLKIGLTTHHGGEFSPGSVWHRIEHQFLRKSRQPQFRIAFFDERVEMREIVVSEVKNRFPTLCESELETGDRPGICDIDRGAAEQLGKKDGVVRQAADAGDPSWQVGSVDGMNTKACLSRGNHRFGQMRPQIGEQCPVIGRIGESFPKKCGIQTAIQVAGVEKERFLGALRGVSRKDESNDPPKLVGGPCNDVASNAVARRHHAAGILVPDDVLDAQLVQNGIARGIGKSERLVATLEMGFEGIDRLKTYCDVSAPIHGRRDSIEKVQIAEVVRLESDRVAIR